MAVTQPRSDDDLVVLLVPARQPRTKTILLIVAVVAGFGTFAGLRSSGLVVPRLHGVLRTSAVDARGAVTVTVDLHNDGRTAARIDGIDAHETGLTHARVINRFPITLEPGATVPLVLHWDNHNCQALRDNDSARHLRIRARTGLLIALTRQYPVDTTAPSASTLPIDPTRLPPTRLPPPPASSPSPFDSRGWLSKALQIACQYGL